MSFIDKIKNIFSSNKKSNSKKKKKKTNTQKVTPVNHNAIKQKINRSTTIPKKTTSSKPLTTRKKQTSSLSTKSSKSTTESTVKKVAPVKSETIKSTPFNYKEASSKYKEKQNDKRKLEGENKKIDNLIKQRDNIKQQIKNTPKVEKREWWDEEDNIFENVGNVFYKLFLERENDKYKKNEEYDKLINQYNGLQNQIEDLSLKTEKYSKGPLGVAQKTTDAFMGGLASSVKGIESTGQKILGQTPKSQKTLEEKRSEKAITSSKGLDQKALTMASSIGAMTPSLLTGGTSKAASRIAAATSFSSFGGAAYNQAKQEGYDEEKATKYGITIGTLETFLTKAIGGYEHVFGKNLVPKVTPKIMNKVLKNELLKTILKNNTGEFAEEYLQEFLNPIVRNAVLEEENGADFWNTMKKDGFEEGLKQFSSQLFNKQNLEAGLTGMATSTVVGLPNAFSIAKNNRQMKATYEENTNTINELKNVAETMQKQLLTSQNVSQAQPIQNEIENVIAEIQNLKTQNAQIESYLKYETPLEVKQAEKIIALRESAEVELNNSQEATNLVNTVEKIIRDKDYNVLFDSSIRNASGEPVNAQITPLANGEIEIRINPNSERAGEFLLMHEVTHAVETEELKKLVMDYASKNDEFNEVLKSLKKTYGTNDVSDEVLADVSGQLFGNQEFIKNLSTQNPSVFKKIYDAIVSVANKITGNSHEALFIKDLKNKWESAYRNTTKKQSIENLDNDTKFSTIGRRGAKNLSKNATERRHKQLYSYLKTAKEIAENNKNLDLETKNKLVKSQTQWFQTKYADWATIISDKNSKILKKLEPNKTYKLGEILEHNILYKAYPGLENLKVKTTDDIPVTSSYRNMKILPTNTLTNDILLRNSDINSKNFRKSLLHEINHFIEGYERFNKNSRGANTEDLTIDEYRNNLGEIISNETKILADLTQEKLDNIILFEQGKENPNYENIRETLKKSNQLDRSVVDAFYNNRQISKNKAQDQIQTSQKNIKSDSRRNLLKNKKYDIELENSSFSMENKLKEQKQEDRSAELLDLMPKKRHKTAKEIKDETAQLVVNKGHYVDKLAEKSGNMELKYKYDKYLGTFGEGHYSIGVAQTNNNGEKIGKSIMQIWKPVEKAKKTEEFSLYLLHKHNIDRWKQGKPVFGQDVTSEISKKEVEQYEKDNPVFVEWAKDINTYNKNQMQNMVDAGLTSKDTQEFLNNTYQNYVRIYREQNNGKSPISSYNSNAKVNAPIKKATGGNKDILPLKEAMARQTIEVKKAIRANEFGLELLHTLNNGEKISAETGLSQDNDFEYNSVATKEKDDKFTFTVFENGEPIKFQIDEGIFKALQPTSKKDLDIALLKPVRVATNIQRSLLTVDNPIFVFTNFFKDILDAPFNSKHSLRFFPNYVRGFAQILTRGDRYQLYRAMGGEQNTYFDYEKGVERKYDYSTSSIAKKVTTSPLKLINMLNQTIEILPRLAEFNSTLDTGGSVAEAMYNASEVTTNFKRGGDLTKIANRNGAIFLNASVQGADKLYRNLSGQRGFKGYMNLITKVAIMGVAPSLINDFIYDDDEEYKALPDYVKDSYYLFKLEDGNWLRIPKGRMLSVFGTAARRTKEFVSGEKDAFDGFIKFVATQVAPNNPLSDNVLAPISQVARNKSWNGSDIVNSRLEKQLPKNQYDEKTDAFSKWVGTKFNISPKKVNYLLDQYLGGLGDVVLPFLTPQAESGQNKLIAPLTSKFLVNSTITNKYSSDIYDLSDKLQKIANDSQASQKDKVKQKYISDRLSEMSELYDEKRKVQNSNLSDKEKYEKVKQIQNEINIIAKDGIDNYKNVKTYKDYAKIDDYEYYLNYKKQWQRVDDEELEDLNLMGMVGEEKNNYFGAKVKAGNILHDENKESEEKRKEITTLLIDTELLDEQKAYLFDKYYGTTESVNAIVNMKIDFNEYLKFYSVKYESDKDSEGNTIRNSKKDKVVSAIKKMNITDIQKAYLIKKHYNSYDAYDSELISYINKLDIEKEEKEEIFEQLGFKINDIGNITDSKSSKKSGRKKSVKAKTIPRTKVAPVKLNSKEVKITTAKAPVKNTTSNYKDNFANLLNTQNLTEQQKKDMMKILNK